MFIGILIQTPNDLERAIWTALERDCKGLVEQTTLSDWISQALEQALGPFRKARMTKLDLRQRRVIYSSLARQLYNSLVQQYPHYCESNANRISVALTHIWQIVKCSGKWSSSRPEEDAKLLNDSAQPLSLLMAHSLYSCDTKVASKMWSRVNSDALSGQFRTIWIVHRSSVEQVVKTIQALEDGQPIIDFSIQDQFLNAKNIDLLRLLTHYGSLYEALYESLPKNSEGGTGTPELDYNSIYFCQLLVELMAYEIRGCKNLHDIEEVLTCQKFFNKIQDEMSYHYRVVQKINRFLSLSDSDTEIGALTLKNVSRFFDLILSVIKGYLNLFSDVQIREIQDLYPSNVHTILTYTNDYTCTLQCMLLQQYLDWFNDQKQTDIFTLIGVEQSLGKESGRFGPYLQMTYKSPVGISFFEKVSNEIGHDTNVGMSRERKDRELLCGLNITMEHNRLRVSSAFTKVASDRRAAYDAPM